MARYKRKITANDQYIGTCIKCKKRPEALLEGFCQKCQQDYREEFIAELNRMGFDL